METCIEDNNESLQVKSIFSFFSKQEDNFLDSSNNVIGLTYRPLGVKKDHPTIIKQSSINEGFQFSRIKKRSIKISVSNKSFGQKKTIILLPTDNGVANESSIETSAIFDNETENVVVADKPLKIFLDGPYGSPTRHIFQAQHAVLIATGIGITPYASILQSIMQKFRSSRHTCPNCSHKWTDIKAVSCLHLRKVDFFWLNRHQRSFEWFVSLLSELEIEQANLKEKDRFLDMHMYITSALNRADMKAVGLQMAMDLLYEKEKRCLITGLKTRTHPGRPNWNEVFTQISNQNKGDVTVFFCGSYQLAKTLHMKCNEFGFKFRKEIF